MHSDYCNVKEHEALEEKAENSITVLELLQVDINDIKTKLTNGLETLEKVENVQSIVSLNDKLSKTLEAERAENKRLKAENEHLKKVNSIASKEDGYLSKIREEQKERDFYYHDVGSSALEFREIDIETWKEGDILEVEAVTRRAKKVPHG
jgi:ribosomal protein L3